MADKTHNVQKKESENEERVERTRSARVYTPNVDIVDRKDDIILMADMPGVDESSIDITLDKNVLSIYGRVDLEAPEALKIVHAEYGIGDYQRSFTLSSEINREKIKATLKNGVLKLVLPKIEPVKAKKITVEADA